MAAPLTAVRACLLPASTSKNPKQPPPPPPQLPQPPAPLPSLKATAAAAAVPLMLVLPSPDALAVGGELGILEGRSVALVHPLVMGGLFAYTLWAGYLGWQWRRVRTIQDEINELKKQLKPAAAAPASPAVFSYTPTASAAAAAPYVADEHHGRRVHASPAASLVRYPGMAGPGMVVAEPVAAVPEDALVLDLQLSLAPAGL